MDYPIRKEVLTLNMYKAGKPISEVKREFGLDRVIKLASNENPYGCSEKAKEVLMELTQNTQLYPDASNYELKNAIANHWNVKPEEIFCGTGSDSLLKVVAEIFISPGDETVVGEVTFSRYESVVKLMGGKCIKVPMKDGGLDIEKMVDSITNKTKIIWFCNPNNPTATIFTRQELEKVIDRIPKNVIIVMDEAYIEYVENKDFPDSISLLKEYPNIIILRTFSKAYGLAGLRCGYGIANEELVKYFNTIIGPFDVNLFAQKAAAAAIKDNDFIEKVHKKNRKALEYLYKEFSKMGLPYIESNTNFIMVDVKCDDKKVADGLLRKGIIVRPGYLLGVPGWLRITVGDMEQNKVLIDNLKELI